MSESNGYTCQNEPKYNKEELLTASEEKKIYKHERDENTIKW